MKKYKKAAGTTAALLLVLITSTEPARTLISLPESIRLGPGIEYDINIGYPYSVELEEKAEQTVSLKQDALATRGATLISADNGNARIRISLLGITLKTIAVSVREEKRITPGGHAIGVAVYTKGALVVGGGSIADENGKKHNPAAEAGIKSGDIILEANGVEVTDAKHLSEIINGCGNESVRLLMRRDGETYETTVTPVRDAADGQTRLGLWVRDSTSGIGTLTYCDKEKGMFAALGHGIADADTGKYLTVKGGDIVISEIIDIIQGKSGQPGELRGSFSLSGDTLGSIKDNNIYGIYGSTDAEIYNPLYENLPAGSRETVHEGDASILSTVDGGGIKEYTCRILRTARQKAPQPKSFIIEITDPALLEITGGIVQGMSGSPVLQDGHIIGAVTHVFINDPSKGYGVYIEWMLEKSDSLSGS